MQFLRNIGGQEKFAGAIRETVEIMEAEDVPLACYPGDICSAKAAAEQKLNQEIVRIKTAPCQNQTTGCCFAYKSTGYRLKHPGNGYKINRRIQADSQYEHKKAAIIIGGSRGSRYAVAGMFRQEE